MRRFPILILTGITLMVTSGAPLRSCREIRQSLIAGHIVDARFDVTGTVSIGANPADVQLITVADDSGPAILDLAALRQASCAPDIRAGERYRMTGHFETIDRDIYARVDLATKVGDNAPFSIPSVTGTELTEGDCVFSPVRLRGRILDVFHDELDPAWSYFVLHADGRRIYAFFTRCQFAGDSAERLIDATVEITGVCNTLHNGARKLLGPYLVLSHAADLRILAEPPADPFAVPVLEDVRGISADVVEGFGRRRVTGTVLAVSHTGSFMIATDDGRTVDAAAPAVPTPCGTRIEVCGRVSTDIYHINLHKTVWRHAGGAPLVQTPERVTTAALLTDTNGNPRVKAEYHGRLIRLEGTVRNLPEADGREWLMHVESDGVLVPVDPGTAARAFVGLSLGCRVAVTGLCRMEIAPSARLDTFPRIGTFSLVMRRGDDIAILSRPSWWTPMRLAVLVGALLALLIGFCIWNILLNRLVERRSHELMRVRIARDEAQLKTEERMRLAVELHDTIAQEMTGVALQLDAAELAAESDTSRLGGHLASARLRLRSCRENLRNCLWDLRNRPFETRLFADAVRRTLSPHLDDARLSVTSDLTCHEFSDNAIHAVLCILRELAINATRHGQARSIAISANRMDNGITLRVADDGIGFDPLNCAGPAQGHFGLQGVGERINRLGGVFHLDSAPGQGTTVTINHVNPQS